MEAMWVRFYLRAPEEFTHKETLQRLFASLVSLKYRLLALSEAWPGWNERAISAETTPLLQSQLNDYLAGRSERLVIKAVSVDEPEKRNLDFLATFVAGGGDGYVLFSLEADQYFLPDHAQENYLLWLSVLKELYQCLRPFYAHEVAWNGGWVDRAMVMNRNIPYLYGTNIFGPELVAHIGQERLLNAPAWRRELLDDGAIFLVPIERFPDLRNPPNVYAESAEARLDAAARSLGMRGLGDPDLFESEEEYEEMPDEMEE